MTRSKEARRMLSEYGKEKQFTELRRRLKNTLSPPQSLSKSAAIKRQINNSVKEITRVVGRYPSEEVLNQLAVIHGKMKEQFLHQPDEAIEWLLGGSSEMARGGFQPAEGVSAAQKFKEFLQQDPSTISSQKLLTNIETIATAMGYRAIHASWVTPPFYPETDAQQQMDDAIQAMMGNKLTRPIGEIYVERGGDDVAQQLKQNPSLYSSEQLVLGEQQDVSTASEAELESQLPKKLLDSRTFRKEVQKGKPSWVGAASEYGIGIRGHTSGTCPLSMAAIDGLCGSGTLPDRWLANDANFKKLAGALLIPTFARGDYHSIAETAAGVHHYLNERGIKRGDEGRKNEPMEPYEAFSSALSMMTEAVMTTKIDDEADALSIRDAVSQRVDDIKQQVQRIMRKEPFEQDLDEEVVLRENQSPTFLQKFNELKEQRFLEDQAFWNLNDPNLK